MNNSIGKSFHAFPFVIKEHDSEEKVLYYTGDSRRPPVVNVGTIGHVGWGRGMFRYTGRRHYSDYASPSTYGYRRKLGDPYLDFVNGGLIVGGRVIWILPDPIWAKFHKKAAEWVLPSKEYVKEVVARYLGKSYEAR